MSGQMWKRHVATVCGEAWALDPRAIAEVIERVEELIAAQGVSDPASVQVFLSVVTSELGAGRTGTTIRIRVSG